MYRVRYYDRFYHPDHFRKGFLGWCIRVCNLVRWKLEVFVQYLVVRYFIDDGATPEEVSRVMRSFRRDVEGEKLEKVISSPLLGAPTLRPRVVFPVEVPPVVADETPPADNTISMFERYTSPGRSSRYAHKRSFGDPDGDFEPVEKPADRESSDD